MRDAPAGSRSSCAARCCGRIGRDRDGTCGGQSQSHLTSGPAARLGRASSRRRVRATTEFGAAVLPEYRFIESIPHHATVVVDLGAEPVRFVYPLFGPALSRTVIPAGREPVLDADWVVTAKSRSVDNEMERLRGEPTFDDGGVRVWAPRI